MDTQRVQVANTTLIKWTCYDCKVVSPLSAHNLVHNCTTVRITSALRSDRREIFCFVASNVVDFVRKLWGSEKPCRSQCSELTRFSIFTVLVRQNKSCSEGGCQLSFPKKFSIVDESSMYCHTALGLR